MIIAPIDVGYDMEFSTKYYSTILENQNNNPIIATIIQNFKFWFTHGGWGTDLFVLYEITFKVLTLQKMVRLIFGTRWRCI